jgi:arginyl-tRNA synthetase
LTKKLPPHEPAEMKGQAWAEVRVDQGAVCVFLYDEKGESRFKTKEGDPLPMIIQKSDGAFLYATTDLAAIRYRLTELAFHTGVGAQRIIYVTDARQKLHFQMFFATARAAGWVPPDAKIEHVTFGAVLGDDRRPLRTREGGTIKLRDLLDEAEKRALGRRLVDQRRRKKHHRPARRHRRREICGPPRRPRERLRLQLGQDARHAGQYGAVHDVRLRPHSLHLSQSRRAVRAAGRVRTNGAGGARRPDGAGARPAAGPAARDDRHGRRRPRTAHASDFMRFYEACPVLQATDEPTRLGRMRLCDLAARTLRLGLSLLGIEALERM